MTRFVWRYIFALLALAVLAHAPSTGMRYAAAFVLLYAVTPSRRKRRRA